MFTRVFSNMACFSSIKYEILKGRYLIPPPPKRPLTSYLLFSSQARQSLSKPQEGQKISVTQQAKALGQMWKGITPEQKKKFDQQAAKLRQLYNVEKEQYEAKFVRPFERVTGNQLIQRQFYSKNKFTNLTDGVKAFSEYKKKLTEQEKKKYQNLAEEQNKNRERVAQKYVIPQLKYNNANHLLRAYRTQNPDFPLKKDLSPTEFHKFQVMFEKQKQQYLQDLSNFALSFHLTTEELVKILNKKKPQEQKLTADGLRKKDLQEEQKRQAKQQQKRQKELLKIQKEKIKIKTEKAIRKELKQLEQKKRVAKTDKSKISKAIKQKVQLQISDASLKQQEKAIVEEVQLKKRTRKVKQATSAPVSVPVTQKNAASGQK